MEEASAAKSDTAKNELQSIALQRMRLENERQKLMRERLHKEAERAERAKLQETTLILAQQRLDAEKAAVTSRERLKQSWRSTQHGDRIVGRSGAREREPLSAVRDQASARSLVSNAWRAQQDVAEAAQAQAEADGAARQDILRSLRRAEREVEEEESQQRWLQDTREKEIAPTVVSSSAVAPATNVYENRILRHHTRSLPREMVTRRRTSPAPSAMAQTVTIDGVPIIVVSPPAGLAVGDTFTCGVMPSAPDLEIGDTLAMPMGLRRAMSSDLRGRRSERRRERSRSPQPQPQPQPQWQSDGERGSEWKRGSKPSQMQQRRLEWQRGDEEDELLFRDDDEDVIDESAIAARSNVHVNRRGSIFISQDDDGASPIPSWSCSSMSGDEEGAYNVWGGSLI